MVTDQDIQQKFEEQNVKLEKIWRSVEKTRKYFLWTLIITLVTFVLPFIGLVFAIPFFLKAYVGGLSGLGI